MFLKNLKSVLFADDTTLSKSGTNLVNLLINFKEELQCLDCWCKHNRLDINWSKTFFMFVTNKQITLPPVIEFNNSQIEVVSSFKLLGVTINNKLNFAKYVGDVKKEANKKLYSIKESSTYQQLLKYNFSKRLSCLTLTTVRQY